MTKFVNLTPHDIVIILPDGNKLTVPPSGIVARVSFSPKVVGEVDGIPIRRVEYGEVTGLPDPEPDTYYIVSSIVLIALKEKGIHRGDVLSPDTNPDSAVRDEQGRIIGVRYLQMI